MYGTFGGAIRIDGLVRVWIASLDCEGLILYRLFGYDDIERIIKIVAAAKIAGRRNQNGTGGRDNLGGRIIGRHDPGAAANEDQEKHDGVREAARIICLIGVVVCAVVLAVLLAEVALLGALAALVIVVIGITLGTTEPRTTIA